MIKVCIYKKADLIRAFKISGHANSGPYGYDLVCAGVSAVSFGAVNAVTTLCDIDLKIDQADGGYLFVELPFSLSKEQARNANLILEAMVVSLQTIEREYKQFIQIKIQ
ncbi:ribosomal-processing cysteine protease Prp [Pseudogracilibacillus auburnensis]|uniref:Ribosomal processing cysteine protease Prp n=1 Tax=Pseudogracilibacillus auburnensis TaxID=1494959 RepID=A0A2V3VXE9_9BACI|nr:ribosomal-processing cysteine protease Prp [Pseudogracilibacillus auburnensis]MBO1003402.1 ribosomal-processing cysteine protease Prp [Pseudogracilibacillus auburnensis]PXW86612.1 hypothetical protein DFR56_107133 [Pseudogracilibacillus auburnensis]